MRPVWSTIYQTMIVSNGLAASVGRILVCVTLIFTVAWLVTRYWRAASAAQRYMVWIVACGAATLVPACEWIMPKHPLPMLPQQSAPLKPVSAVARSAKPTRTQPAPSSRRESANLMQANARVLPRRSPLPEPAHPFAWRRMLIWIWSVGASLVLLPVFVSRRRTRALLATAVPCTDPRMVRTARALVRAVGSTQYIDVRMHPSTVPMVYGVSRPIILLPQQADTWTDDRLRNVLLHEIAHVVRRDLLTQYAATLACTLYWFHPLAWIAARALRRERELACDDIVLRTGSPATTYATDLLDLAVVFTRGQDLTLAALPFARASHVRERLDALLDARRIRTIVSRRASATTWGAALAFVGVFASTTMHPRPAPSVQARGGTFVQGIQLTLAPSILVAQPDRPTELSVSVENTYADTTITITPTAMMLRSERNASGELAMQWTPVSGTGPLSLANWIHGLPKSMRLLPHQRRTIVFTVDPPADIPDGAYFATIVIPEQRSSGERILGEQIVDMQPPLTIFMRKGAVRPVLHLDSLTLRGERVCMQLWTDNGIAYWGQAILTVRAIDGTKSAVEGYGPMLGDRIGPLAVTGIAKPTWYCSDVTLSATRSGKIPVELTMQTDGIYPWISPSDTTRTVLMHRLAMLSRP